jgi:hypothetical protein
MCTHRQHRYRIAIQVDSTTFDLVVNAHNVTEAISKADGYVFKQYPDAKFVQFTTHHVGYSTTEVALEHGATFPEEYKNVG